MGYQNSLQDKRLSNIEKHIEVINSELGSVKTDVQWLKWAIRFVIVTQVGILVGLIKLLVVKVF